MFRNPKSSGDVERNLISLTHYAKLKRRHNRFERMRKENLMLFEQYSTASEVYDAIKVIDNTIMHKKVNYVLDCDIKGFFDNVNHEWLMKFLRNDIADSNYLRYIARMLK